MAPAPLISRSSAYPVRPPSRLVLPRLPQPCPAPAPAIAPPLPRPCPALAVCKMLIIIASLLRRETISFFRTAYETNGWKTAADEPLTKRITIVDYPTVAYTFSPYDAAPPVATRAILDKLDSYESVDAPATGAVGE